MKPINLKRHLTLLLAFILVLLLTNCSGGGSSGGNLPPAESDKIIVNSLKDLADPPDGTVTLRAALALAADGQAISFDASLNGGTIELSIVGQQHSVLKGEVMGMRDEPSGPVSYLVGYFDRDYGRSALYARKSVIIDASDLPAGITMAWVGGENNPARVLAVYGDLTMINVSVTGGRSMAEDISTVDPDAQPWTLARGGALAVWGVARLVNCKLYNNYCEGDFDASRDRGAFGGGLYANIVDMEDSIISGNSVVGAGAAGGGVYSVGGADDVSENSSAITRSSITGNRISGYFAYGGGVYSDGGGIGNRKTLKLTNSTIARNIVEFPSFFPFGYWRGGGAYISNGSLFIDHCTIVENQVHGIPRTDDLGKPNLAGGIAATIGNAHAVENMIIGQSVIAGNTVHEVGGEIYDHDIFTGSLFNFTSMGYNRIGVIDFSQMLVPVGQVEWKSLCRKHYPKEGDEYGVDIEEALNLTSGIFYSDSILSAGVDAPNYAVLYYEPEGSTLNQVPAQTYFVYWTYAEYAIAENGINNFLEIILSRIETNYGLTGFAENFTADFEMFLNTIDTNDQVAGNQPYTDPAGNPILTLADTQWFGPAQTWPKELANYPYIEFWHRLDDALQDELPGMGPELLGDNAWTELFSSGPLIENGDIAITVWSDTSFIAITQDLDQIGTQRPANTYADIGAIEIP